MRPPLEAELAAHAQALRALARHLVGEAHADGLVQDTAVQALVAPPQPYQGVFLRRTGVSGYRGGAHVPLARVKGQLQRRLALLRLRLERHGGGDWRDSLASHSSYMNLR